MSSGQGSDLTDNKPSIPILIVGNKIDSVSAATQQELRQACPQQLFMVMVIAIHTYIHTYIYICTSLSLSSYWKYLLIQVLYQWRLGLPTIAGVLLRGVANSHVLVVRADLSMDEIL